MSATTAPTRMTDEEWRNYLAFKNANVAAEAAEMIAELHRPVNFISRRRSETIVLALVTVPARETPLAYFVSTDGDDAKAVAVPKSVLSIMQREADGLFILATMKAWVAADRHMAQANIPGLIRSSRWTPEQREGWKRIQARITGVRHSLTDAGKRGRRYRTSIGTRNHFA